MQDVPFKICLISPPVLSVIEPWYDQPSFGRTALAYLAGYLKQFDTYDIKIIDAKLERLNFQQVLEEVTRYGPNLVGLTAFTNEIKPAAYQAALIKLQLPSIITVIGGTHVTALPLKTLEEFIHFDVGVVGEGEITLHELCQAVIQNQPLGTIPGLVYREDNQVLQTKTRERILDQTTLPLPAWELLPKSDIYYIQTIRGCPYNCTFCMNPNGKIPRKRDVNNVIYEINHLIETYSPKHISFGDEIFSVDKERTKELLNQMIINNIGEKVSWDVQTHVDYVDEEIFLLFQKAKVTRVELGIETGDLNTLKKMGKGTNVDSILKACEAARKAKVKIGTFFLLGQPFESQETLKQTLKLAIKINPDLPMFGIMVPYPATLVAKMAAAGEGGYKLLSTDWDEYNKQIGGALEFANMSRKQIEWFQVKAYLKVYIYNWRFWDLIKFLYQYKTAAINVLKKILKGQTFVYENVDKPADYDVITGPKLTNKESLIGAYENWQIIQKQELKRSKKSIKQS